MSNLEIGLEWSIINVQLPKFSFLLLLAIAWALLAVPVRAEASAVIQNDTGYFSSPTYYVFGEVLNVGDKPLYRLTVEATFKDSNGAIVSRQTSDAITAYLPSNEKAPFRILEWNYSNARLVKSYTLTLTFQFVPTELLKNTQLELLNVTSRMKGMGYFEVSGIVKNSAATDSGGITVTSTFYDSRGKVIYVTFTCVPEPCFFTPAEGLPPGGSEAFAITVWDRQISQSIVNFTLLAESEQYTSIPEWPWKAPVVASAIPILLAIVMLRRKLGLLGSIRHLV